MLMTSKIGIAVAAFAAGTACVASAGPVVWETGAAGGNGNTYEVIVDSTSTWGDADAAAGSGRHLLTIGSAAEQSFVESLLINSGAPTGSYFIGLIETATEGHYAWNRSEPLNYTNWNPGEPNNGAGDETVGGILWSSDSASPLATRRGQWNDVPNVGYPNAADGTPVLGDLLRAGYILETESSHGGGPHPVPLPMALYAFPVGASVMMISYRRFRARV